MSGVIMIDCMRTWVALLKKSSKNLEDNATTVSQEELDCEVES